MQTQQGERLRAPGLGLSALAEELKDAQRVLDALETEDAVASVRAVPAAASLTRTPELAVLRRGLPRTPHPGSDAC
jgi:hypothetical protein